MTKRSAKSERMVEVEPAVAMLARDFVLSAGKVAMPSAALRKWKKAHEALPADQREERAIDLLALAMRFQREAGPATVEAIAQLYVLAAELMGTKQAKASFGAAGLPWGAKKPAKKTPPAAKTSARKKQ